MSTGAQGLRVAPLDASLLGAWGDLFAACACTCHCRYWHFTGTKNDWLARCAFEPEASREEHEAATRADLPEARGLVAIAGAPGSERVVGWLKLTPRASVPKLRGLSVYRAHDLGPDDGVYAIGCLLVHPEHRRAGVARALVAAASDAVRAWGGHTVEAYPRVASEPLSDEEAWMGPNAIFRELGFTQVAGEAPYPVLRKRVTA